MTPHASLQSARFRSFFLRFSPPVPLGLCTVLTLSLSTPGCDVPRPSGAYDPVYIINDFIDHDAAVSTDATAAMVDTGVVPFDPTNAGPGTTGNPEYARLDPLQGLYLMRIDTFSTLVQAEIGVTAPTRVSYLYLTRVFLGETPDGKVQLLASERLCHLVSATPACRMKQAVGADQPCTLETHANTQTVMALQNAAARQRVLTVTPGQLALTTATEPLTLGYVGTEDDSLPSSAQDPRIWPGNAQDGNALVLYLDYHNGGVLPQSVSCALSAAQRVSIGYGGTLGTNKAAPTLVDAMLEVTTFATQQKSFKASGGPSCMVQSDDVSAPDRKVIRFAIAPAALLVGDPTKRESQICPLPDVWERALVPDAP